MIAFHLDESVKNAIAIALRQRGIDVTTTLDADLLGASDEEQLRYAYGNKRVIVAHDNDFARDSLHDTDATVAEKQQVGGPPDLPGAIAFAE